MRTVGGLKRVLFIFLAFLGFYFAGLVTAGGILARPGKMPSAPGTLSFAVTVYIVVEILFTLFFLSFMKLYIAFKKDYISVKKLHHFVFALVLYFIPFHFLRFAAGGICGFAALTSAYQGLIMAFGYELIYRGLIYTSLKVEFSQGSALPLTVLMELSASLMMFGNIMGALYTAFLSVTMTMIFEITDSLWWTFGFHACALFTAAECYVSAGSVIAKFIVEIGIFVYVLIKYISHTRCSYCQW